MQLIRKFKFVAAAIAFSASTFMIPLQARAASATTPINTGAKVSFTFDDGLTSAYTNAAPTLAKYGYTGTDFVITGCVGMTTTPNTCHADTDRSYMTWAQIQALQNTYHWEIGSHTVDHACLASSAAQDADDCSAPYGGLTIAQVDAELANSKAALAAEGINATDMATPYGDYNQSVLAEIAKYYASQRGFADTGYNATPYNDYIIRDQIATGGVSLATLEGYVNQAITNKQWLVLTFHDIQANASSNPDDYQYSTANLGALAAYIKSKSVPVVNINNGLISGTNLFTDYTFDNGLANGWTTDNATYVKKDTGNHGSYPSPTNSISMTATTKDVHLFSPKVAVDSSSTYVLQSFLNLTKINTGYNMGYYVDEYDANGNWISGQYKQGVSFAWPQTTGFEYKPTSSNVKSAALQVIVPANSEIQAYVDNFQWINENNPTTPPPVQTNLVANGTFDAGIASGWTTDGAPYIAADNGNNGSPANPVNSIKLTSTTKNIHLFSPKVAVSSTNSYNLSAYLNIKQISGTASEIGFYMDEYDANGNWISGKYITGDHVLGANTISFNYTPSSANVKQASLQVIVVANSNIVAYLDNVVWVQN
ncbi:MAG TPA: polysaccharide deacetylase family protein [Candidatus Nitrosopolaris sp.]|nr:polysaccharide deacetylase family protein [Candidatus Nitrosopolaris sp.]